MDEKEGEEDEKEDDDNKHDCDHDDNDEDDDDDGDHVAVLAPHFRFYFRIWKSRVSNAAKAGCDCQIGADA